MDKRTLAAKYYDAETRGTARDVALAALSPHDLLVLRGEAADLPDNLTVRAVQRGMVHPPQFGVVMTMELLQALGHWLALHPEVME